MLGRVHTIELIEAALSTSGHVPCRPMMDSGTKPCVRLKCDEFGWNRLVALGLLRFVRNDDLSHCEERSDNPIQGDTARRTEPKAAL
jgi:hypothetical protein